MLAKLFRKIVGAAGTPHAPLKPAAISPAEKPVDKPTVQFDQAAWDNRLQAALGDDAALLDLCRTAPQAALKQAAVAALTGEETLRQVEREFRNHDKRLQRLAKQRLENLLARRTASASAAQLIASAGALLQDAIIPANRLVDLDRSWRALDATLIDAAQQQAFAALQAQLQAAVRERSELQRALNRWASAAAAALQTLRAASTAALDGLQPWEELHASLANASAAATRLQRPATTYNEHLALDDELQAASAEARAIGSRLALLAECASALHGEPAAPENTPSSPSAAAPDSAETPLLESPLAPVERLRQRWHALAPLVDPHHQRRFEAHFARANKPQTAAQAEPHATAQPRNRKAPAAEQAAQGQPSAAQLTQHLADAEAALERGALQDARQQLAVLHALCGPAASATLLDTQQQNRLAALEQELARLKSWQQWSDSRARDALVAEAEALAADVAPAPVADTEQGAGETAATATADKARPLPLKQHAQAIESLRARWKKLDQLGAHAASQQAQWRRFDAALQAAYLPVAQQQQMLAAQRAANLAARQTLLAELATIPTPNETSDSAPDWRSLQQALDQFHSAWRKLGPLEHTVPHKARAALLEQLQTGVARLDAPLQTARVQAEQARRQLIARARELPAQGRDAVARLRELQSLWQQQAKALPLARNSENALWAEFKQASDTSFAERDDAMSARKSEWQANRTLREGIITRLEALAQPGAAHLRKQLALLDAEWRSAGAAEKSQVAALEARYQAARQTVLKQQTDAEQLHRQTLAASLRARLDLCRAREAASGTATEELARQWQLLTQNDAALPAHWQQALQRRFTALDSELTTAAEPLDTLLLQLEAALDLASPAGFQSARQRLKLQAMKQALEGRQATTPTHDQIDAWLVAGLSHARTDALQNQRLDAIAGKILMEQRP